jgi:hypothetical protein
MSESEILTELRRPFTPSALQFKIQSEGRTCLVVGYVDARQVGERLNLVVPERWTTAYRQLPTTNSGVIVVECELTVQFDSDDGFTTTARTDVGAAQLPERPDMQPTAFKAAYSDAFKRSSVHYGVNVPTYYMPQIWIAKSQMDERNGKTYISKKAEATARERYRDWLVNEGIDRFGEPLDLGDTEHDQGDFEVGEERPEPEAESNGQKAGGPAQALVAAAQETYAKVVDEHGKGNADRMVRMKLMELGVESLADMSEDQAKEFHAYLKECV